ncbi:hypothetical protein SAMN05216228_10992 [Rhizobium tibeticum]|uniref:Transposase IS4-like domain-containing protein n=1 Tax=Rhizobium tibeticum TaxID=501024 RepID=A0ABY1AYT7_9HYPH|nr:hypothetical protein SAMN05216228_10992 [Rhizobium tibeticum]
MLERHIAFYGEPPRQAAADGGYASRENLSGAKARGIRDMAFHKKRGLSIEDMVSSRWVYRKLRNFRAGIEAGISCLKRAYGLGRAAPGVGSTTSRLMSGPRWSLTISPSSHASGRPDAPHPAAFTSRPASLGRYPMPPLSPDRSSAITCMALCRHAFQKYAPAGKQPLKNPEKQTFMDGH